SEPSAIVLVHDCYPLDAMTATRERRTAFWSGDIWRLILLLKKYRPDLKVNTVATRPTGLGVISNLDPSSRVLSDNLDAIIAEYLATDYSVLEGRKADLLGLYPNEWPDVRALIDSGRRA
ncbi:MAG: class I SAM-dependent methyltransferase, partial [Steroidobacterales bacterium]